MVQNAGLFYLTFLLYTQNSGTVWWLVLGQSSQ